MEGEDGVGDSAGIGEGPGDVPGVLLDGFEDTALIGADGVIAMEECGFINLLVTR